MKFVAIASIGLAASVAARSTVHGTPSTLEDSLSVPGDNPLFFCQDPSTENYILELKSVDLSPNPPLPGETLKITAKGTLEEDIEEGAKIHLQVKYGVITIIRQTADLCDTAKNVDLECPLKKGDLELTKEVDLPAQIPPGKYTVLADVYTADDHKITCLTASVEFHRAGLNSGSGA